MRLLNTGPSEGIEPETTRQALETGHNVRALARSTPKLALADPSLEQVHDDPSKMQAVEPKISKSAVYFDGSCPLCRAEIQYYRRQDQAGALCFVDVSETGAQTPAGITQQQALERFHVRAGDGQVLSGAAAFVEVWARLPNWRWAARAATLPGAEAVLEWCYRGFLPIRPLLSRLFSKRPRLSAASDRARRG